MPGLFFARFFLNECYYSFMRISSEKIYELCCEIGFDTIGIAKAEPVKHADYFRGRIKDGFPPDLNYLNKYQDERFDPGVLLPNAKAIIVTGTNYYPTEDDLSKKKWPYSVAKYAWGKDYHIVLRQRLKKLRRALKQIDSSLNGRICVDTAPFMDVYWAWKAGIGWIGKNSLLVNRQYGIRLLIGSLIIDRTCDEYSDEHPLHCGKCTSCIEACPTGAIEEPYKVNAEKCISYWTIESKAEVFPESITRNINGLVFGCDICSDICPFNRFQKPIRLLEFARRDYISKLEIGDISEFDENFIKSVLKDSPISRPGLSGLERNINSAGGK